MKKDHNKVIQKMYKKYNVEPHCRCCGQKYIFGVKGDSRLICPTTGRGDDTLLHLRTEVENGPSVIVTYGESITPREYVKNMSLFNMDTIKEYINHFIKQESFKYTDESVDKMRKYIKKLIDELPIKVHGKPWYWTLRVDMEKYTTTFDIHLV